MPFVRRQLTTLRSDVADDIERHAPGVDAHQRGSFESAAANALAGAMHMALGALEFFAKQLFDDTADNEFILRRAQPFGITLLPAVPASGSITLTGNNGATVPAGTQLTVGDYLFETDAVATIAAGVAAVDVTAVLQPFEESDELDGAGTNQNAGTALAFITPVANVDAAATVAAGGLIGGSNQESIARLKARFSERKKTPPRGGSKADYVQWCKEASADVTRVFVNSHLNAALATEYGSVLIFPVTDNLPSPIPSAGLIADIEAFVDPIRPVGAKNIVIGSLTPVSLNVVFSELVPNTADVQAAIDAEIADLLIREGNPGDTLLLSHLREAISSAVGEQDFAISSPAADVPIAVDQLLVKGTTVYP